MVLSEEELTRNMMALDDGLHRIEKQFEDHVVFFSEDPLTFGGEHFVLYPVGGSSPRFAIEEHYPPGVGWSDEDRVPGSWTWVAEAYLPQPDGSYMWVSHGEGEIASQDYRELLTIAETWARALHDVLAREAALTPDPPVAEHTGREDPGRTWPA
ncbi:hypothetical protein ACIGEP_01645 [Microbacterium sp. NPDC077663]|uniref:hypothetical protein n=1 Tax=Microbacterium sp. NPDC077663 TaxID=3364189 RepID=UPI0037C6C70D